MRAIDAAGNVDPTPASYSWTEDKTTPTTTLTTTPPSASASTSATFNWTTDETATFSCRVDANAFAPCGTGTSGTKTFTGLGQGSHTFNIRARDGAGNITPLPGVSYTWTVDTGPPDTLLDTTSAPANPTASANASFTFSSTEPTGATFKCKLDGAATFTACTSPQSYTALSDGSHTFSVEAIDAVGNIDPSPATYTWLVDITNPTGALTAPVAGATVSGTTAVTATANDNVSVLNVQFKLDGADLGTPDVAAPYSVNWDTTVTADGPHTLTAVIKDEVLNTITTTSVNVTVSNATHPVATATNGIIDVGPGSVDATTRNVIRTSAGRVYIIANDDSAAVNNAVHAATGPGVIRAYQGNQTGTPSAFAEADAANHPVSGSGGLTAFGGVDVRLGDDGVARAIFNDNSFGTNFLYRTFSTITNTWGPTETIDSGIGTESRGRIRYAMALDASNVPHVVWVKGCPADDSTKCAANTTLSYSNRAGGTWSTPVAIATGGRPIHPMLAFDTNGVLHLSWMEDNGSASTIKYATRTGATWSAPETVPTGSVLSNVNADQGPSIATDSAGHPYVLYVGPSLGTFGPAGRTAVYGEIKAMEKVGGSWTDVSPPGATAAPATPPDYLSHTPQVYTHGNDLYAFNGHDTDINFAYARKFAGGSWTAQSKLGTTMADGSASIRWDPLHETDAAIIDAATYDEDRLGNRSFLGEVYYAAVLPTVADSTPPTVSLTAPAAGTVTGTVAVSANAGDNVAVAGVTFMLDGSSIAAEDTTSPYSINWDTTTASNGTHTLTAIARDTSGNTTTSASVTVTVSNTVIVPAVSSVLFGATTVFTPTDTNLPGAIEAFDVGTVAAGSLARVHVWLDAPLPSTLLLGLYSNNAGAPGTLLSSTSVAAPATGWNDVAFGPLTITLGTRYWLALLTPNGAANGPHFRDARTGGAGRFVSGLGLTALPVTWPSGGSPNTDGPLAAWGGT
ncbi:MAG: hypothetical protein HOQ28_12485 [Thermoleophilia bacterium]|nr:hypothetical protein [Thermoleophilia bacterium]